MTEKNTENTIEIKCPVCGDEMFLNKGGAFCDQCEIKIWRRVAKKEMTDEELRQLVEKGKVFLKGLISKAGKEFEAYLVLSVSEDGEVDTHFEFSKKDGKKKSVFGD
ncbi:MAG: topoisomerase C-terminal repeat-containing protein [Desulfonauticus sp.]|nr:topoisomerase C-terminal repeat-containing protein [Desulfonauticus sp.]